MPAKVWRHDYRPSPHRITEIDLRFELSLDHVRTTGVYTITTDLAHPLELAMGSNLELEPEACRLDGRPLGADEWVRERETQQLRIIPREGTAATFELTLVTTHSPTANTQFMGLYASAGALLTQCESDGFRRITPCLDRPDVLSRFRVTLTADFAAFPVLLAGGDCVARSSEGQRHSATFVDPCPKPCYLFALVAGKFNLLRDTTVTAQGRTVALEAYTQDEDVAMLRHALTSVKEAMAWDEHHYGLSYDLDTFRLVAARDFNYGAMENTSLNIFSRAAIVTRPDITPDEDYDRVKRIVAHEYFHHWSGNRVTLRDWFQLTLKEGLTVYRDTCFAKSCAMVPELVSVETARLMRRAQYAEDASAMAHPIRPESYESMENFYTATVYEKGAQVIRMLHTWVGEAHYRRATDFYFATHRGQAVTCDDWLEAFVTTGAPVDLALWQRWYRQAGTPRVVVRCNWDPDRGVLELVITQKIPCYPFQTDPQPLPIPMRLALFERDSGRLVVSSLGIGAAPVSEHVLYLDAWEQRFELVGVNTPVWISPFRDYSAPVHCEVIGQGADAWSTLARCEEDLCARWDAVAALFYRAWRHTWEPSTDSQDSVAELAEVLQVILADSRLSRCSAAFLLNSPSLSELHAVHPESEVFDPLRGAQALLALRRELARKLEPELSDVMAACEPLAASLEPTHETVGARQMVAVALAYLATLEDGVWAVRAATRAAQVAGISNHLPALRALVRSGNPQAASALVQYRKRWGEDPNLTDQWLRLFGEQPYTCCRTLWEELARLDPQLNNDPRHIMLALLGMIQNAACYWGKERDANLAFTTERLVALDAVNSHMSSRVLSLAFTRAGSYPAPLAQAVGRHLALLLACPGLSTSLSEVAAASERSLAKNVPRA